MSAIRKSMQQISSDYFFEDDKHKAESRPLMQQQIHLLFKVLMVSLSFQD